MPSFKLPRPALPGSQRTGEKVLGAALATALVGGGVAMAAHSPTEEAPTLHFNDNCFGAHAAPAGPVDRPITGTLPDGRTFTAVLDPASTPSQRAQAADALCTAKLGAATDAGRQQVVLDGGATGSARDSAEAALETDRRTYAATDLGLLHGLAEAPPEASPALTDVKKTPAPAADAFAKDFVTLKAAATTHDADARAVAGTPVDDERWYVTHDLPDSTGKTLEPLVTATADGGAAIAGVRKQFEALAHDESSAAAAVLSELTRGVRPLWTADHPGAQPTPADEAAVEAGIAHGKKLADVSNALELPYRKEPGVAQQHLNEIVKHAVAPAFAQELPGTKPTPASVKKAQGLWTEGASDAQIRAATVKDLHGSVAWRKTLVRENINRYYPQPDGWSCGPSSSTNVMGLLGIAPETYALRQKFANEVGARKGLGTPGDVGLLASAIKRVAKRDYGVEVTGYTGLASSNAPIIKALKNGYVVMVNGDVVLTDHGRPIEKHPRSGHFLVIKAIDAHGNFEMADPWRTGFANYTVTPAQFSRFTHGGVHVSKYWAFTRKG